MPDNLMQELTDSFQRFPGIGPRQAKRFVYYLLHASNGTANRLLDQIAKLRQGAARCSECQRFYFLTNNKTGQIICDICRDENRDANLLMLVEKDIDLENVLKTGTYNGQFFVLSGLIKILDKQPVESINGLELLNRVRKLAPNSEIIAALSANQEGDHTVDFLKKYLEEIIARNQLKFSTLGRGLSTGVEVEYSDADTLKNALKNREARS